MLCFISRWLLCWLEYELCCRPVPRDISLSPRLRFGVNSSTAKAVFSAADTAPMERMKARLLRVGGLELGLAVVAGDGCRP
jgi:hypothetical protein